MNTAPEIQELARLAGIELSEERAAGLVIPVRTIEDAARALASIEYGDAEPSGRFRAPKTGTK